jgi:hypothetical protein
MAEASAGEVENFFFTQAGLHGVGLGIAHFTNRD